ncbi:15146_t:CDS:2, partial [Acaulospora colombiana]
MPTPAKTHLPIKQEISSSGLLEEDSGRDNEADVALLRLPAPSLRGTFAKAYSLLTRLVAKIGWDELLKCRSSVFVMEEEYRMQKAAEEERKNQKTSVDPQTKGDNDEEGDDVANVKTNGLNDSSRSIPKITVSNDSEEDPDKKVLKHPSDSQENDASETGGEEVNGRQEAKNENDDEENEVYHSAPVDEQSVDSDTLEEVNLNDEKNGKGDPSQIPAVEFKGPELEKPLQAANDDKNDSQSLHDDQNKDLRVYTVWRSEVSHYKNHQMSYRKTGTEWEILGDLAARLHRKEDAKEAYKNCLEHKFSSKAWLRLLEFHAEEGEVKNALTAAVKLAVYHERWYHEII